MLNIDFKTPITYVHSQNKVMHPPQDIFEIYNADKTTKLGELVCHKTNIITRPDYKGPILAVDYIKTYKPNTGLGTAIINFAHQLSKEKGCNGYLTLKADSTLEKERIPHIFYRKLGFSTFDKKTDRQMDKFIKQNKSATIKDFPSLVMHYPPLKDISKSNLLYNKFIKRLFSIMRQI